MNSKDWREVIITALICIVIVVSFTACTSTSIETDSLKITHRDFHPIKQAVETDVTWEGVGTLSTRRTNDGSEALVEATGSVVDSIVNPLN